MYRRDYCAQTREDTIKYAQMEAMALKKGFSSADIQKCLEEYAELGNAKICNMYNVI